MEAAEADVVDIEEFAKANKKPPKAKAYRIRIDKTRYVVHVDHMTGRQLLELAGKSVDRYKIYQQISGGGQPQPIGLNQTVDFTAPGIERFKTLPIDSTDGLVDPKRDFQLSEGDAEFLENLRLRWEAVKDGDAKWVIVSAFGLPAGFNVAKVDLAVRIAPDYPTAQLDMAYFAPALARADGRSINGLSMTSIAGLPFQQWSRHRTGTSAWRAGVDDLESHFLYIQDFLQRELLR